MTTTQYKKINKHIIDEIATTKNLAKNTILTYTTALNQYSAYHQQAMQELLDEADDEEEQGIRLKRRKIKTTNTWIQTTPNNTRKTTTHHQHAHKQNTIHLPILRDRNTTHTQRQKH